MNCTDISLLSKNDDDDDDDDDGVRPIRPCPILPLTYPIRSIPIRNLISSYTDSSYPIRPSRFVPPDSSHLGLNELTMYFVCTFFIFGN